MTSSLKKNTKRKINLLIGLTSYVRMLALKYPYILSICRYLEAYLYDNLMGKCHIVMINKFIRNYSMTVIKCVIAGIH